MATKDVLAGIEGALARVAQQAETTRSSVQASADETRELVREIEEEMSALDRITQEQKKKFDGAVGELRHFMDVYRDDASIWVEELEEQLALLEVGGQRVDEFLRTWGDMVVTTEEGGKRLREIFEGLDLRGKEQEIQSLAAALQTGKVEVSEALEFLAEAGGRYAKELREVVQAIQEGRAPIERLVTLIKQIEALAGDDSAFARLAGELHNLLLQDVA